MKQFAYFGRLRGGITTQKYVRDMVDDGLDWLSRSKLSRVDKDYAVKNRLMVHEANHQLVDPLKQPTGRQIKKAIEQTGKSRQQAYRDLQKSRDIYGTNIDLEYSAAGLDGKKPHETKGELIEAPWSEYYWKGRRTRKGMTTQHMAAQNILKIAKQAKITPFIFDKKDMGLIDKAYQGLTSNQENSYLLRKYGKSLGT